MHTRPGGEKFSEDGTGCQICQLSLQIQRSPPFHLPNRGTEMWHNTREYFIRQWRLVQNSASDITGKRLSGEYYTAHLIPR